MENEHPLYIPTRSMNIMYASRFDGRDISPFLVAGNEIHADLYRGNMHFRAQMGSIYCEKKLKGKNSLTGVITLIHSDAPVSEGTVGSVETTSLYYAIPNIAKYIVSVSDTYNAESGGGTLFRDRLQKHINLSGAQAHQSRLNNTPIFDINQCNKPVSFSTTFHHTEQAYINSMYSLEVMNALKPYIRRHNVETFFGMITDLNSFFPVCINCNIALVGFQNTSQDGYLANFVQHIQDDTNESIVEFPDGGPSMHTRVSCTHPEGRKNQETHHALTRSRTGASSSATEMPLILSNLNRNKIVQSYADVGDIHRLASEGPDTFNGHYFTSSALKDTVKFENFKKRERQKLAGP